MLEVKDLVKNFGIKRVVDHVSFKVEDGKILGAITHAIVDNPLKGYGISIEKMLESVE